MKPSPVDTLLQRAASFAEQASFDAALELLDRALTKAGGTRVAEVLEQRAFVRVWQTDLYGAIRDFRAAIAAAPEDLARRARCQRKLGNLERLVQAWEASRPGLASGLA